MSTIISSPRRFKLFGATLAMAVLAVVLLAVVYATGQAQAQPDPNLNDGKYTDPQPCGLNVSDVPDTPRGEFSEGHVALFDAYWDYNTQTLNNNLCPPLATHTVVTNLDGTKRIDTGRTASNIDVNTTVFHAGDEFQHTITDAEKTKYDFLPPAGTEVWWLEQDDPIAEAANPGHEDEPELVLGLSAGLFHEDDWFAETCNLEGTTCTAVKPLEYHLEAERGPEGNVIPFVVFENDANTPIWDSRETNTHSILLDPGEYKHYNWVFFPSTGQSHTYVLEVHMKGHVRIDVPTGQTKDTWKPLTWPKNTPHDPDADAYDFIVAGINKIVTSELVTQQYTIHVGPLTLDEQPMFKAPDRRIPENSNAGTNVGDPVPVTGAGGDTLTYGLSGEGHANFEAVSVAQGGQIRVASGADLDYETKAVYDLVLTVSDGKNREGDDDNLRVDGAIAVKITLENEIEPGEVHVTASVSQDSPGRSATITFTATPQNLPDGTTRSYTLKTVNSNGSVGYTLRTTSMTTNNNPRTLNLTGPGHAGARSYVVEMEYTDGDTRRKVYSEHITVNWQ